MEDRKLTDYIDDLHKSKSKRMKRREKREALKKKTGFDTTAAVQHIQEEKETNEVVKTEAPKRRVQPKEEASEPARRSTTNYKVVTKQED